MNKAYRLIKNRHSGLVQVAPETAKAHGKGKSMVKAGTVAAVLACASPMAWAADIYWNNVGTGDWFTTGNWNPSAVPTNADTAYIDNGGTAQVQAGAQAAHLEIGYSGTGHLEISDGGTLNSVWSSYIGNTVGSSGTVTVDGEWSTLTSNAHLDVGGGGTGILTISDGGTVNVAQTASVGTYSTSSGTATVDGAGSSLTSSQLYVGNEGIGTFTISNGGTVSTSSRGIIGVCQNPGCAGIGTVTVDGAGASWSNSGTVTLGIESAGAGTLVIRNGGTVSNTDAVLGDSALFKNSANASGTVTVDGAGSSWNNSGNLTIGKYGTGTLTVSNGGAVSNTDSILGDIAGSSGTATVDGIGSSWSNSGTLTVGKAGTGALTVSSGGTLSNTDSYLGTSASGTVTVDGAGSTWTNTGNLYLGYLNTGALNISNGGVVNSSVGWLAVAIGTSGTATVDGAGSTWTNSGNLLVGDASTGTLTITNGGAVSNTNGTIGSSFASGSNGTVTVDGAGSTWTNSATLQVGSSGSGTLTISRGGVVNASGTVTLANSGTSSGTLNIGNGAEAGILNATTVNGGSGTGGATLNFNHTDGGYYFTSTGTAGGTAINITGRTAVNHKGSGTTILTGANTYTGGTTVDAGTLRRSLAGAFVSNTAYTVNGGTLHLNNLGLAMSSLSGSGGTVNIGTATLTVNQSGNTGYAGTISGTTGTLIKLGTGTLTLTGTSATDYTRVNGGTLGIAGGGALSNVNGYLGYDAADSGTVTVDGAGSSWINSAGLFVGYGGNGTLNITNGGAVSNTNGNIGYFGGSSTVTVDGPDSTWTSSNALKVGYFGSGTLNISNGGAVSNTNGILGDSFGSSGTATVTGAGSSWSNNGNLTVGDSATGTLVISSGGVVNVATGTVTLANQVGSSGTLSIGDGGAAGVLNATTVNGSSGTAMLNFNHTDGAYYFTNDGTAGGTAINITGSTVVNHTGTGTTTLSGTNTYSGATTISAGTLEVGAGGTAGSLTGNVTNNGALVFNRSDAVSFNGDIDGSGSLTKSGAGTLTLTGANSYTGGTTISAGSLEVGAGGTAGSLTGNVTNNSALVFNRSDAVSFSGDIDGTGSLTKTGAGTLTLTGANTYTGTTHVNAGTLQVGDGDIPATSIASDIVTALDSQLIFNLNGAYTYSRDISGAGSVRVTPGSGYNQLILTGTNTHTGGTTIDADMTVSIGSGGTSGSVTGDVVNNGQLTFHRSDAVTFDGVISGSGNVFINGGNLTLTGDNTYTGNTNNFGTLQVGAGGTVGSLTGNVTNYGTLVFNRSDAVSFVGDIDGSGSLTKSGAGTLTLTGVNSYTGGTTISAGTLEVGAGGTAGSLAGNVTNNSTLVFNRSDAVSFNGDITGTGSLTKTGGDTLTLTGANTYSGGTTVSAGTLQVGAGGTAGSLTGNVTNNGALVFNRSDAVSFNGDIDGSGSLTKSGAGTLTLTGTNTYSGATTVSGGTLAMNGSLTNSAVTVNSGGTLGGSGNISGAMMVNSGGTLAPGNSPGLLTVGSLTLDADSLLNFELGDPAGVAGTDSDLVAVTGNLTLAGKLQVTPLTGFGAGSYRLFNYGGTLTDNGATFDTMPVAYDYSLNTATANQVNLAVTAATAQYWNGANVTPQHVAQGSGGSGAWDGATTNWTNAAGNGSGAHPIAPNLPAIFAGTAGTVTIANGFIASTPALSFLTDGYLLDADGTGALELTGAATVEVLPSNVSTTIAAPITGTAGLAKSGAGTLTLTGANSYTGGTTVTAGTLQVGAGGTAGSLTGNVTNNGALVFNRSDAASFNGDIDGTGSLTQSGAGTLTLTGANSYTGGTTVSAGTLQVGAGGTAGSLTGNVTNNSALVFNRSDAVSFNGDIDGSGSLTQSGAGTLTLTGANSYTGGTTVTAGTLQIGVGGTVGSLTGNVTNNGALVFNRSDAVSFNGDIDGTGSLTKTGAGTLTLTGANTYTGGTTISAGKLAVNGSLTNSAVTVNSGGTLGGSGNIGDTVTVNSGGTLAPGNSIGTSTVTGDFTLDSGATLEVELKSGGNTAGTHNDHVNVSGTATIADGAKLHVTPEATADKTTNPGYAANTQYTILTAGGGLTVNGAQVVADDYPYLNFTASHDSTRYYLTSALAAVPGPSPDPTPDPTPEPTPDLTPGPSIETFRLPGMSPNQGHVADAAFRLGAGNPLYDRLLNLTSGQVDSAFDSLFGTSHVFAASLAFSAACEFHDLLGQRLNGSGGAFDTAHFGGGNLSGVRFAYAGDRQASLFDSASGPEAREGFWMRALASKGRIDGDGNGPGADTSAAGLALGADREINPETRVGLAFAYTRSAADPRSAREDVEVTSYQLAAYGRWQGEAAYLNSSLSFGRHRTESRRDIVVMSERAEAAYDADSLSLSLETGRPLFYGPAVLTPYFGLEAAVVDREGFTEKGSNAALQVQGRRDESLRTRAGLRYQWQGARFQPTVDLAWVHEFGDRRSSLDAAFASAPAATRFATNGPELDRDRLAVGVGFTAWSGRLGGSNARVSVGYRGEFAGNGRDHSLGAEVRWVW